MPNSRIRNFRNCYILCGTVLLVLAIAGVWFSRSVESGWESMLSGPFVGQTYQGSVLSPATSALKVSDRLTLEIHRERGFINPIVVLRDGSNKSSRCSRVMIPIKSEFEVPTGTISEVQLSKVTRWEDGYKVRFLCLWSQGGREGGIIYLDKDLRFVKFAVSW